MYSKITSIYLNNIKKEENKNLCLKIILWTMEVKKLSNLDKDIVDKMIRCLNNSENFNKT